MCTLISVVKCIKLCNSKYLLSNTFSENIDNCCVAVLI